MVAGGVISGSPVVVVADVGPGIPVLSLAVDGLILQNHRLYWRENATFGFSQKNK